MNYLITIVGPTAIGKTALSIKLAQYFKCEIISCDSRQFYKEMSIGTACPSKEELSLVKHHFIHNKSIFDSYTVGDFEKEAIKKLDELYLTNGIAILVGGSGLYVDAILKGLDEFPEINPDVRQKITSAYNQFGIEYLQTELQKYDPKYFAVVTQENPQRMMRALEVCIGAGKPYSSFLHKKNNARNFMPIVIGLKGDRAIIYERINGRVDEMINHGLLDETRTLYVNRNLNALQTVGYKELFSYLDDEFSLPIAFEEIKKHTRHFAKRQMTWFNKNEKIKWFDYKVVAIDIINYIKSEFLLPKF